MLALFLVRIDDCRNPFRKQARVQRKDGPYYKTSEVYDLLVPHIREAPHGPVFVNISVTPVSSTIDAVFDVIIEKGMHSVISPRCFPSQTIRWLMKVFLKNSSEKHHFSHVRYVKMQLALKRPRS